MRPAAWKYVMKNIRRQNRSVILQGTFKSHKISNLKVESIPIYLHLLLSWFIHRLQEYRLRILDRLDIGFDEIVKCVAQEIELPVPDGQEGQSSFSLLPEKPVTEPSKLIQVSGQPQGFSGLGLWDDKRWKAEMNN